MIGDRRLDPFGTAQLDDLLCVVSNDPARVVDLPEQKCSSISIQAPPLADKRIREPEVDRSNRPPVRRDLVRLNEVRQATIPVLLPSCVSRPYFTGPVSRRSSQT
jgi:hypothetical protein